MTRKPVPHIVQSAAVYLCAPISSAWLPLAGLLGFAAIFWRYQELVNLQWDFGAYYVAGKALLAGGNPYDPDSLKQAGQLITDADYHGLLFLYPPLFLRILTPLFYLDLFTASFVWFTLKCMTVQIMLLASLKLMRARVSILSLGLMNFAALTFHPIGLDFAAGNVAVFEGTLVLSGLWAWSTNRKGLAAALITLGSFMKISPFLLALYPLHRRNKRFLVSLAICIASLAILAALDWRMTAHYFAFTQSDAVVYHWDEQVQSVYNISLTSFILRTFAHTYFYQPLIDAAWLVPILTPLAPVLIFLALIVSVRKHEHADRSHNSPTLFCALLLAVLLVPPRLAGYTLCWTLFPCAHLLIQSWNQKHWSALVLTISGIFLLQWYFPPSQIKPGLGQLLVDSELLGLLSLYISACLLLCRHKKKTENNKLIINDLRTTRSHELPRHAH